VEQKVGGCISKHGDERIQRHGVGWTSGRWYVYDLLPECDILCLQEHWLLQEHLDSFKEFDFLYTAVSGVDSSQLLYGRPYGGCAILYRKSLSSAVLIGPKSPSR